MASANRHVAHGAGEDGRDVGRDRDDHRRGLSSRWSGELRELRATKTILLTTFKRDGSGVATPVSVAFAGERAYFRTYDKAWKTKRLARNPQVVIAPCTIRGQPTGPSRPARARLLQGREAAIAAAALARRHRVLQRLLVPLAHRAMDYRTMHYELQPDAEHRCEPGRR